MGNTCVDERKIEREGKKEQYLMKIHVGERKGGVGLIHTFK